MLLSYADISTRIHLMKEAKKVHPGLGITAYYYYDSPCLNSKIGGIYSYNLLVGKMQHTNTKCMNDLADLTTLKTSQRIEEQ